MSASSKQLAGKQMLKNIETNRTTANNLNDVVFRIKWPFPKSPSDIIMAEPSEKSSTSSKRKDKGKATSQPASVEGERVKILVSSIDDDPTIKATLKKQLTGQLKKLKLEHEYGVREEQIKAIEDFNTQLQRSNPSLYIYIIKGSDKRIERRDWRKYE